MTTAAVAVDAVVLVEVVAVLVVVVGCERIADVAGVLMLKETDERTFWSVEVRLLPNDVVELDLAGAVDDEVVKPVLVAGAEVALGDVVGDVAVEAAGLVAGVVGIDAVVLLVTGVCNWTTAWVDGSAADAVEIDAVTLPVAEDCSWAVVGVDGLADIDMEAASFFALVGDWPLVSVEDGTEASVVTRGVAGAGGWAADAAS